MQKNVCKGDFRRKTVPADACWGEIHGDTDLKERNGRANTVRDPGRCHFLQTLSMKSGVVILVKKRKIVHKNENWQRLLEKRHGIDYAETDF